MAGEVSRIALVLRALLPKDQTKDQIQNRRDHESSDERGLVSDRVQTIAVQ